MRGREQVKQCHAQIVDVRARVALVKSVLFGRGIALRADIGGVPIHLRLIPAGGAEIHKLQMPMRVRDEIGGFQIPIDDGFGCLPVKIGQHIAQLQQPGNDPGFRQGPFFPEQFRQGASLDEVHDKAHAVFHGQDVHYPGHHGMAQPFENLRLLEVLSQGLAADRQHLHRPQVSHCQMLRLKHGGGTPAAELADQPVSAVQNRSHHRRRFLFPGWGQPLGIRVILVVMLLLLHACHTFPPPAERFPQDVFSLEVARQNDPTPGSAQL